MSTNDKRQLIFDLAEQGVNKHEIAEQTGYNYVYVCRLIKEARDKGQIIVKGFYEKIIDLYDSGMTIPDIAKALGYKQASVYCALSSRGKLTNGYKKNVSIEARNNEMLEKYRKGTNVSQLMQEYDCSRVTIQKIIQRGVDEGTVKRHERIQRTKADMYEVVRLWNEGVPKCRIRNQLNVAPETIDRLLKKAESLGIEVHRPEKMQVSTENKRAKQKKRTEDAVRALFEEGLSTEEIASKLNLTNGHVCRVVRYLGLRASRKQVNECGYDIKDITPELVTELWNKGMTLIQIGETVGISGAAVYRRLNAARDKGLEVIPHRQRSKSSSGKRHKRRMSAEANIGKLLEENKPIEEIAMTTGFSPSYIYAVAKRLGTKPARNRVYRKIGSIPEVEGLSKDIIKQVIQLLSADSTVSEIVELTGVAKPQVVYIARQQNMRYTVGKHRSDVITEINKGKSFEEVRALTGCTERYYNERKRELGLDDSFDIDQYRNIDQKKIRALVKAGWSFAKVANEFGLEPDQFKQVLKYIDFKL